MLIADALAWIRNNRVCCEVTTSVVGNIGVQLEMLLPDGRRIGAWEPLDDAIIRAVQSLQDLQVIRLPDVSGR